MIQSQFSENCAICFLEVLTKEEDYRHEPAVTSHIKSSWSRLTIQNSKNSRSLRKLDIYCLGKLEKSELNVAGITGRLRAVP